ncbi:MAG: biotin/lipoyl-binding protein [Candidatus Eisenbacteria bacterium]|uniref:Biotin/lipoyl-binding protein n=1 Tax=Eiseniibacteriota bacterium TaxID=2212470 RepID=A0A849SJ79_UNCEI|nr:biotin/lipoyl-binding protein [Candidatus Eisenbacteria bacterium]
MKFWVTLEGRDAEVEFRTDGDRLLLDVEGRHLEADFRRLQDGEVYSLLIEGRSYEVRVAQPERGRLDVTLGGRLLPVEVRHPLEKRLQAAQQAAGVSAGETVNAPMPGLVVAVRVKPGDRVEAGQSVVVVEAMKMQNELTVRHAGIVKDVLVAERASVSAGQALVKIGPVPA